MKYFIAALTILFTTHANAGPADDQALLDAAFDLNVEEVEQALKSGADPNAFEGERRISALKNLTYGLLTYEGSGDPEILSVDIANKLFAAGAKLKPNDKDILFFPISQGVTPLIRLLLEEGASPVSKIEGYTPTELAKKYKQERVYEYLLTQGGIPVSTATSAQIFLIEAAQSHDIGEMKNALDMGAKINGHDPAGLTALLASLREPVHEYAHFESISWLLDNGANPNVHGDSKLRDIEGIPLHVFIVMNRYTSAGLEHYPESDSLTFGVMRRLLRSGAKVSVLDSKRRTPLHIASRSDNIQAARILILEGAKIMPRDLNGLTPLDYAESAEMIAILKENGATE